MRFAEPLWLFGVLFALAVGGLLVWGAFRGVGAMRRFGQAPTVESLLTARVGGRRALKGALSVLSLAACFVALSQPQYGWGTRRIPATNLDVILVLDYSKSMYARDVAPNRIERAKGEVARLIAELPGARFGAVAFAGEPLSFPLTSDGGAIAQFFRQLTPHDMPVGGTAIARALEAGRSLLERDPQSSKHRRVMLLVTDGEDLEGDPVASARAAKEAGISISVVQIGGRTPEPIPDIDEQGIDRGLRRDNRGRVMTTSLSAEGEKQLAAVAETTGGSIVRSGDGATGIEEVTRRLRAMMTEELSERIETVYADVYAYPLGVALVLLLLEAFLPEVRRPGWRLRRRAPAADAPTTGEAPRPSAPSLPAAAARTHAARAIALLFCLGSAGLFGCDEATVDRWFLRHAPEVDEAIRALETGDAGAARKHLTGYLGIGPCRDGVIGVTPAVGERPQASFDLGLALFELGERYGEPFGEDPGRAGDDPRLLARRSAEVACALAVVRDVAERPKLALGLRAQAFYLAGNLEFLRREYAGAVDAYDRALALIPGDEAEASAEVGRRAAHNRALALRLAEENQPEPPERPDAGPPQADAGGGEQPSDSSDPSDPQQDPGDQKNDSDNPDNPPEPEQQPDPSQQPPDRAPDTEDSQQPAPTDEPDEPQSSRDGQPPEPQAPPPLAQTPSQLQDEKVLDQLERAPTVQQEAARAQRGRLRRAVEDK